MDNKKIFDPKTPDIFQMMFGVPLDELDKVLRSCEEEKKDESAKDEKKEEEELPFSELPDCDGDCDKCGYCSEEITEDDLDWRLPNVTRIVFQEPATVVFWSDGTKTVVKCAEGQQFDRYAGFCAAVCKKLFGTTAIAKEIMETFDTENWKRYAEEAKNAAKEKAMEEEKKKAEKKHADSMGYVSYSDLSEAYKNMSETLAIIREFLSGTEEKEN